MHIVSKCRRFIKACFYDLIKKITVTQDLKRSLKMEGWGNKTLPSQFENRLMWSRQIQHHCRGMTNNEESMSKQKFTPNHSQCHKKILRDLHYFPQLV